MPTQEPAKVHLTPQGRVINHSLFNRDQYTPAKGQPGTPSYKIEMAFEKEALNDIFNACLDYAVETWGEGAEDGVVIPIKDGDEMAAKREKLGKPGDAYAGMDVIRASTQFNRHGEKGPGGIQVLLQDKSLVTALNESEVYQGCYGIAAITISGYAEERTGNNAITFYLSAFQKTDDGERLVTQKDHSDLFKAVGRVAPAEGESVEDAAAASGGRRRRAG